MRTARSEFERALEARRTAEEIAVRAGLLRRCDSCGYAYVDVSGNRSSAFLLAERLRRENDPLMGRLPRDPARIRRTIDEVVADAEGDCHCHPLDAGD